MTGIIRPVTLLRWQQIGQFRGQPLRRTLPVRTEDFVLSKRDGSVYITVEFADKPVEAQYNAMLQRWEAILPDGG